MSEERAFLLIHATPNPDNMNLMPEYLSKMMPVFGKFQGEMINKFKVSEQLVGEGQTKMVAIVSFPKAELIQSFVKSDDYKEHTELRAKVFTKLELMLSQAL
jgi:uncharacterized protein (DUF1330 family)